MNRECVSADAIAMLRDLGRPELPQDARAAASGPKAKPAPMKRRRSINSPHRQRRPQGIPAPAPPEP